MLLTVPVLSLLGIVSASAIPYHQDKNLVLRSPNQTESNFSAYAPVRIQCPSRQQWVRRASDGVSPEEAEWTKGRKQKVLQGLTSYLGRLKLEDFDLETYLERIKCEPDRIPTIGFAISGGGWLSGMTGTGALRAFDDRFGPSVEQRTGGILQSMTYLSGLSGGSWPVMSLATYNNPTIEDMVSFWHTGEPGIASKNSAHRATGATMFQQIIPKFEAGFNVSLSEYLGRSFAYEFVAGENGGLLTTVSSIAELSAFKEMEMPLPMWQAVMGTPDDIKYYNLAVPYYNATMYEFSPLEFGTWESNEWSGPASFFPTKYLGTRMVDGKPEGDCITGFDSASFMLGAAADAINFWLIEAWSNYTLGSFAKRDSEESHSQKRTTISPLVEELLSLQKEFKKYFNYTLTEDIFATLPNPFALSSSKTNNDKPPANLTLIDNSEAGQALPLLTQVQTARDPEFIITWDADGDAEPYSWSNGTNLYNSMIYAMNRSMPFPLVPEPATFMNRNYSVRPTFFGCDANLTSTKDLRTPIILYLANAPYSSYTNFTWYQSTFSDEQTATIMTNGFNLVTQGNSTLDHEWPECLGCAAIDRSVSKLGMERTEQCQRCMTKYCWDGTEDNSTPPIVDPALILDPEMSFEKWNKSATATFWAEVS